METEIGDLGSKAAGASDSSVMILTCPECATSYFVDDSKVAPGGRTVKCSNCGARWTAVPEGVAAPAPAPAKSAAPPAAPASPPASPAFDEIVFEAPPAPEPVTPARKGRTAQKGSAKRKGGGGAVAIWIGAAVAAAALIGAAIAFRTEVVQMLPASAAAYAGLGMPVSSLVIEKVKAEATFEGGRPVLQVSGQIRNESGKAVNVPSLRINLLDWSGKVVAAKVARPVEAQAPAKAVRYFAVTLADPPISVHDLDVTFETEKGQPAAPAVRAAVPAASEAPAAAAPAAPASK
jgi:predicted Zn finger-like uncharacterized protein